LSRASQTRGPSEEASYGLRAGILSQWETLAQSLASIAPTACSAMGIPLVIAVSGASAGSPMSWQPWVCFKLLRKGKLSLQNLAISAVALLFLIGALVGSLNTGSSGPGKWLAPVYVTLLMLGCVYKALWHRAVDPLTS
jgi:hypothetical protein